MISKFAPPKKVFNKYLLHCSNLLTEQSAVSHAITVRKPLYVEEFEMPHDVEHIKGKYIDFVYMLTFLAAVKVSGTPADCVRLALGSDILGGFKPDIVLSGINRGNNSGTDLLFYLFHLIIE